MIQGNEFELAQPWRKARMIDLAGEATSTTLHPSMDVAAVREIATQHNIKIEKHWGSGRVIEEIFAELCEKDLVNPTFVTHHPVEISPLARQDRDDPHLPERFELFIGGREIANGYSELNDTIEQRKRFEDEQLAKAAGDHEAGSLDEDYLRALEFGMPPTAGLGIGIDRLVMLLSDAGTIKDVILFPTLRPEAK
jgi:lysyl-tRNA synthetase class 2